MELTLSWQGPYRMDEDTPARLRGGHGVFVNLHKSGDSEILYIGKAERDSILSEAKSKANRIVEGLRESRYIGKDITHEKARVYVNKNCSIYLAVIPDDELQYINSIEKCLIRKTCPPCNAKKYQKISDSTRFILNNKGERPNGIPKQLYHLAKTPDQTEFTKILVDCEDRWGISDCVYYNCIEEFKKTRLEDLNEKVESRILTPFLLNWGTMGRVLGFYGVQAIHKKLKELSEDLEPIRKEELLSFDICKNKARVIRLFNEIQDIKFNSKNGKGKRAGPTAASKTLHLVAPDLFIPWDANIRKDYKIGSNGRDYFYFLLETKHILLDMEPRLLTHKNKKSLTKMIDTYNWAKANTK